MRKYVRDRIGRFAASGLGQAAAKNYKRGKTIKRITGAQANVTLGNGRPQVAISVGKGKIRKTVYTTGQGKGASGPAAAATKGRKTSKSKGPTLKQTKRSVKTAVKFGSRLGVGYGQERKQRKAQKNARKRR